MLSTICLALVVLAPQGGDWPHYRGPDRTGSVKAGDWSPIGRDEPLWAQQVGRGYSCPSIVGDRLVTMGYHEQAGVDRIVCLDRSTGTEHWRFEFAASDAPRYHEGGTLTTPTIADGLVYCLSRHGKFHVLQLATGKLAWSRDYVEELALEKTFHGFSASPLLADGRIFLQFGGVVAAVDAGDGKLLWRTEDLGDLGYSNLALLTLADTPALAAVLGMTFVVIRREDGKLLHEYPWRLTGNAVHCAMPIVIGKDRVFLSTAYNKGCAMLQLAVDKAPEPVWSNRLMRNKVTACVEHEGHLYGFDESMLRCLDLAGNARWRVRGLGLGSLSIVGGRLLVLDSDGELIVAEATPAEFRELSRKKVLDGGVYWTMPVFAGGLIYVRNSLGDLRCLDHRVDAAAAAAAADAAVPDAAAPDDKALVSRPAPTAAALFSGHHELVDGSAFRRPGQALRLRGKWSISLRGLADGPMSLTLVGGDRWDLRLDEGGLVYTCDGQRAWAIEPQGPRMIEAEERFEHQMLFPLPELFAPSCPEGATTAARPVRFAETWCWRVESRLPAEAQGRERTRAHYFDVATGRLVGSDGVDQSTLVLVGSQRLAGLTLPLSITRFRAEDGQQHIMQVTQAEWIAPPDDLFSLPLPIQRILRTPAEIARDDAALRQRFGLALARYRATDKSTPLGDQVIELRVHDGDLWFATSEPEFRIRTESEVDGVFGVDGPPIRLSLVVGQGGSTTAIKMFVPDGREVLLQRLPD